MIALPAPLVVSETAAVPAFTTEVMLIGPAAESVTAPLLVVIPAGMEDETVCASSATPGAPLLKLNG
jgi:hypothetical protein